MRILLSLALLSITTLVNVAEPPKQEELGKEINAVMRAPYEDKSAVLKKHTHPNVLKLMGGDSGFEDIFRFIEKSLKNEGISFDTAVAGVPYSIKKSEKNEFFCVKVTLSLKKGSKKIDSELVQIAVRPTGSATWCYLDGSNITMDQLKTIFPDLPEKFSLAEPEKKADPEKKSEAGANTKLDTIPK